MACLDSENSTMDLNLTGIQGKTAANSYSPLSLMIYPAPPHPCPVVPSMDCTPSSSLPTGNQDRAAICQSGITVV